MAQQPDPPHGENPYDAQEYVPYMPDDDPVQGQPPQPTTIPESAPPTPSSRQPSPPTPSFVQPPSPIEREAGKTRSNGVLKIVAVIGVVIVLFAASAGTIYAVNQVAQNREHMATTATAVQANSTATEQTSIEQAQATHVAQVQATATAYASTNPYPTYAVPKLNDPLTGNDDNNWYVGDIADKNGDGKGSCGFTANGYDVTQQYHRLPDGSLYFASCSASATNFTDFVYQVRMTILKGDCGGLLFRDSENNKFADFYYFDICQDGSYNLIRYQGEKISDYSLTLAAGNSSAIKQGSNQSNLIAVAAHGDTFDLYVNRQHVGSARNGEYSKGSIGVVAVPQTKDTEVVYNNAQVWVPSSR